MRRLLEVRLRREKQSKTAVPFHEALPFASRCSSCQIRPVTRIVELHGESRQFCQVCALKQEDRRGRKSRWLEDPEEGFEKFLEENEDLHARYYKGASPDQIDRADIRVPNDLEEIGQKPLTRKDEREQPPSLKLDHLDRTPLSKPGYVGFIYADGDGVGSFIGGQSSVSALKKESERIPAIIRQAVYRALAESLHPKWVERKNEKGRVIDKPLIHPFEIITIGGDDVLLIVPAHVAVPVAVRICQLFQGGAGLTMSAGVVIADDHNPVRFLRDLAHQLLKSAKKRARQEKERQEKENGNATGALDFLVLRSQSMVRSDLEQLRRSAPYYYRVDDEEDEEGEELQLTAGPYTLDEALKMLRLLVGFRRVDFPKSQLHALTTVLREGRSVSSLFYLYQQIRLGEKGYVLGRLAELWSEARGPNPRLDIVPWRKFEVECKGAPRTIFRTPLPDLAELYDFVSSLSAGELGEMWSAILEE